MASASVPSGGLPAPVPKPLATPPRSGTVADRGVVRRADVRAAHWTVDGTAKVTGVVDADTIELDGSTSIGGRLTSVELRAEGMLDVQGDAVVKHRLAVAGTTRVGGTLHAGDVDVRGTLHVGGTVDVDRSVLWRGCVEVGAALTASRFAGEGRVTVGGTVTVKDVDLAIDGPSSVAAIVAESVRVRRKPKLLGPTPSFEVERIDANLVELEGVHVEYLRASRIVAGEGCRIARFDGTVVRKHASARLGPSSVSAPPHGLFR
jgi:cytoskeletal protein CcmA (bactofilin family)